MIYKLLTHNSAWPVVHQKPDRPTQKLQSTMFNIFTETSWHPDHFENSCKSSFNVIVVAPPPKYFVGFVVTIV